MTGAMKDHLFWKACEAGVSIEEYELAHAILHDQELDWAYHEDLGDDFLDALDMADPVNESEAE